MQPSEKISAAIHAAGTAGRTALVPFITAGYPDKNAFAVDLKTICEVGDVVEIGVPFSDPMADGLTIQRSSYGAIQAGVSLAWILDSLDALKDDLQAPIVLMSYLNPLLAFGLADLATRARAVGVCGFIVPDLPYEECHEFRAAMLAEGLALIQLVTPATPPERLQHLASVSSGFIYAVTVRGITGTVTDLPDDTAEYLARVAAVAGEQPVCAGFGIRRAEQVRAFGAHVQGVVVGSALIEHMENGGEPRAFLEGLLA